VGLPNPILGVATEPADGDGLAIFDELAAGAEVAGAAALGAAAGRSTATGRSAAGLPPSRGRCARAGDAASANAAAVRPSRNEKGLMGALLANAWSFNPAILQQDCHEKHSQTKG
jgi:hypothetical protein